MATINDYDLWWHLTHARHWLAHGVFPAPEAYSAYASASAQAQSFVANTLLGDLVLYSLHNLGGEAALQGFRCAIILSSLAAFIYACGGARNVWTLLGGFAIILGMIEFYLIKNQIFALPFCAAMVSLWAFLLRGGRWGLIWLFPVLLLLWSCMHGSAMLGFFLLALLAAGAGLEALTGGGAGRRHPWHLTAAEALAGTGAGRPYLWQRFFFPAFGTLELTDLGAERRRLWSLAAVVVLSYFIVSAVWPMHFAGRMTAALDPGSKSATAVPLPVSAEKSSADQTEAPAWRGFKNSFRILFRGGDENYVAEYASPFDRFNLLLVRVLLPFTAIYVVYLLGLRRRRKPWSLLLPGIFSAYIALGYLRTTAFSFCVALPFMGLELALRPPRSSPEPPRPSPLVKASAAVAWVFILLAFALQAVYLAQDRLDRWTGFVGYEMGRGKEPFFSAAIPEMATRACPGRTIFNSYSLGGYLMWRWNGSPKVVLDGRTVLYPASFLQRYYADDSLSFIEKEGFPAAVLSLYEYKTIRGLLNKGWHPLALDRFTLLLTREVPAGAAPGTLLLFTQDKLGAPDSLANRFLAWAALQSLQTFAAHQDYRALGEMYRRHGAELRFLASAPSFREDFGKLESRIRQSAAAAEAVGDGLLGQGESEQALGCYLLAAAFSEHGASLWNKAAAVHFKAGRLEEALEASGRALEIEPRYAKARYNRAAILEALGRGPEAISDLEETSRLDASDPDPLRKLWRAREKSGQLEPALEILERLLRLEPKELENAHEAGRLCVQLGRMEEARRYFSIRYAAPAASPQVEGVLAHALSDLERHAASLEHYRIAVAAYPRSDFLHYNFARSLEATGNSEEARRHYLAATEANPRHEEARLALARLLRKSGK